MILDSIQNAEQYFSIHRHFSVVFDYLKNNNLSEFAPGNYPILEMELFVIISENMADDNAQPKPESHKKYIDVQVCLEGDFSLGWTSFSAKTKIFKEYDDNKDFMLFDAEPECMISLLPQHFAIFFHDDLHTIFPPDKYVKKAVFKVAV